MEGHEILSLRDKILFLEEFHFVESVARAGC